MAIKLKQISISEPTYELVVKLKAHLACKTMKSKTFDDIVGASVLLLAKKESL